MAGRAVARRHAPQPVGHAADRTHGLGAAQNSTPATAECRILPGEMLPGTTPRARNGTQTGYTQHLPAGRSSPRRCSPRIKATLLAALDTLQAALEGAGIHTQQPSRKRPPLAPGTVRPDTYYDARIGTAELGTVTGEAFAALRHRIAEAPAPRQTANDVTAPYKPAAAQPDRAPLDEPHVFEGCWCVEDDNGSGSWIRTTTRMIPAQFVWAGDFREGRAEVQDTDGDGADRPPGLLRHTSRIRNRRLRPRRPAWCMQQRALGRCSTTRTPPHEFRRSPESRA